MFTYIEAVALHINMFEWIHAVQMADIFVSIHLQYYMEISRAKWLMKEVTKYV